MEVSVGGRSNNCKASLSAEAEPLCKATAVMVVSGGLESRRRWSALLLQASDPSLPLLLLGGVSHLSQQRGRHPRGIPILRRSSSGRDNSRPPR